MDRVARISYPSPAAHQETGGTLSFRERKLDKDFLGRNIASEFLISDHQDAVFDFMLQTVHRAGRWPGKNVSF